MSLAKKKLEDLSRDPATRRLAKERADAFWLYHMHLGASERKGRAEGEAKGLTRGRADALLKLLGLRFGPVSEATQARIDSATLEQLDVWTERVLSAKTTDEVLAP